MSDPRSLAGIEGLLLECSPVLVSTGTVPYRAKVDGAVLSGRVVVIDSNGWRTVPVDVVEVDLSARTGRCHAAWFVQDRYTDLPRGTLRLGDTDVVNCARCGSDLPPGGMARLRDLVLLAAGRGDAVASSPTSER